MKLSNPWLKVAAAVVLEPMWVLGMKHSDSWPMYLLTAASLILSFFMILKASDELPVGTVYAIFVGLGTAATIVANWMFYGEAMNAIQLSLITVLLFGVIGLKLMEDA